MTIGNKLDYKQIARECFDNVNDWKHNKLKSAHNHNYFTYKNGYEVYAESDDDNTTEYYLVVGSRKYALYFAISFVSQDDKLQWDYIEEMDYTL